MTFRSHLEEALSSTAPEDAAAFARIAVKVASGNGHISEVRDAVPRVFAKVFPLYSLSTAVATARRMAEFAPHFANAEREAAERQAQLEAARRSLRRPRWAGQEAATPAEDAALPLVTADSFAQSEPPPRAWHSGDIIPAGAVGLLAAPGGTRKSTLMMQAAICTTLGLPFLGLPTRRGPVIYLAAEDDVAELHRRSLMICGALGVDPAALTDLHFLPLAGEDAALFRGEKFNPGSATKLRDQIAAEAAKLGAVLVVIDGASDAFESDENNRAEVKRFIRSLAAIALGDARPAIIIIAHPSKAGQRDGFAYSGSTAWHSSARFFLTLDPGPGECPPEDERLLTVRKSNYGPSGHALHLRWNGGAFERVGAPGMLDRLSGEARADRAFLDCLAALSRQGRHVSEARSSPAFAPKVFAGMPASGGISKRELAAAMERHLAAGRIVVTEIGTGSKARRVLSISSSSPGA